MRSPIKLRPESRARAEGTPAKLGVPYNITGVLNFMNAASRPIVREIQDRNFTVGERYRRFHTLYGHSGTDDELLLSTVRFA